jgi:hypothetical protein
MSARRTALLVALGLLVVSGCALITIEYAPLPDSWNAFLVSVAVLLVVFWGSLILGAALLLLLAIGVAVRHFANPYY